MSARTSPSRHHVCASPGRNSMFNRRDAMLLIAGGITMPEFAHSQQRNMRAALYANVGPELTHYDVDVAGAELIKKETVTLPAGIQYVWPHASRRYLYVA